MPKSGFKRHVNMVTNDDANGTTIITTAARAGIWSNTADQITSMTVLSSQTNGLAVGTVIELYAAAAI